MSSVNRAERFEDEKKRIIQSCFARRDADGSVLETYITHIRVTEYSSHPSSPPPPQARTPQSEKPRVIVVSVRKSGRVQIHKTKENVNGTYSIGKTWTLDDLSAIESYTGPDVSLDFREWAGNVGFTITIGKSYYWEAQTDKEKKFFIASLIKIYNKYTSGRNPALTNFDQDELTSIVGGAAPRRSATGTPQSAASSSQIQSPPVTQPRLPAPEQSSIKSRTLSNDTGFGSRSRPSDGSEYRSQSRNGSPAVLSPAASNGNGPTTPSYNMPQTPGQPPVSSLRRLANNDRSQDSLAYSQQSNGETRLAPKPRGQTNGQSPYGSTDRQDSVSSLGSIRPSAAPTPSPGPEERPPERKRPPMDPARPSGLATDEGLVPAPLMGQVKKRDVSAGNGPVMAPPPRNTDRMSPRKGSVRSQRSGTMSMDEVANTPPDSAPPNAALPEVPTSAPRKSSETPIADARPGLGPMFRSKVSNGDLSSSAVETEAEPRPGLGSMIKAKKSKGDLAGALWKAATAATAFKPRAGGAGDKLRQLQNKSIDGPDGINGVVPAPPRPKSVDKRAEVPEVKVSGPGSSRPTSSLSTRPVSLNLSVANDLSARATPEPQAAAAVSERPRPAIIGEDAKYLATLEVDPAILDYLTNEFTTKLDEFSWVPGPKMRTRNFDEMQDDIERELNQAQAGGWLARFEEEDDRVNAIKTGIDLSMDECEELDNLLTLYSVELSTLREDIEYIEAQGQGLQVQAANQKALKKELKSLLETCAITEYDLRALLEAPLEDTDGVQEIESTLVKLFKAMVKIDPTMGTGEVPKSAGGTDVPIDFVNGDYAKMRVVREKKRMYEDQSNSFMRRLVEFMARQFEESHRETKRVLEGALSKKVDSRAHDSSRSVLWKYSPLMLYSRDFDLDNWNRIIQVYQDGAGPVYQMQFRDPLDSCRRNARKSTGEEKELLFTHEQEKKEEGLATTARKATVKRTQTLARNLRGPVGEKGDRSSAADGRSLPYEVFATLLDDLVTLVEMEQNFMVDFFHATSLEQLDFADAVNAAHAADRRGGDLKKYRPMEPDRDLARRVTRSMEIIFDFLEKELQNVVEWVLGQDSLQAIGVLAALERKLSEINQSNQDYLNGMLQKLHGALVTRIKKFVDEQIRAIEDTKVKIKKRKGVISFMRVFPSFSTAIETMLASVDSNLAIRKTIDREYERILKSMFDSLKVIARENPAVGVTTAGAAAADPEDKEALNYHILLIENMNHYMEDVDTHGLEILQEWRLQAQQEVNEHMNLYLNAVMRRPLGRLLEQLENIESQLNAGKSPASIAGQPSNSKATFNKILGNYDAREVRKGIEALRKRVEKHFNEEHETGVVMGGMHVPGSGGGPGVLPSPLTQYVVKQCEVFYGEVESRIGNVVTNLYGGDVLFEWPRAEVKVAFR